MKELQIALPYEVSDGAPTVSFLRNGEAVMMPYQSLVRGTFVRGVIELEFDGWKIQVNGEGLKDLWRGFQRQSILEVRQEEVAIGSSEVTVTSIAINPIPGG